jgi:hypothetical protein
MLEHGCFFPPMVVESGSRSRRANWLPGAILFHEFLLYEYPQAGG